MGFFFFVVVVFFYVFCFIAVFCHVDIDVCIYSTCAFFDCQVDFDVDNVQRREFVNLYGVQRCIRVIIIIISSVTLYSSHKGQFHQMD